MQTAWQNKILSERASGKWENSFYFFLYFKNIRSLYSCTLFLNAVLSHRDSLFGMGLSETSLPSVVRGSPVAEESDFLGHFQGCFYCSASDRSAFLNGVY